MDEREDELARLLEHARGDAPGEQLLNEVRARLLSAAASTASAGTKVTSVTSAVAPAAKATLAVKLGLGALAFGVVTTVYFMQLDAREPPPASKPAAPIAAPTPVTEPAPLPTVEVGPAPEPPQTELPFAAPRRAARRVEKPTVAVSATPEPPPEPAAPAVKSAFAEELSLIKAALQAQRAGHVAEAREKLAEHARRFPEGQLKSERTRIESRLPQ